MDQILVVIPYCSQGAQGRELEYAVAGWRRHFKEKYKIVIAGEHHPIVDTGDDICCVQSERVPRIDGQYRQHLDYVSCFRSVRDVFPDTNGFIMVADDCYAVNDFDLTDVKFLKAVSRDIFFLANPFNGWEVDKVKTRRALIDRGLPINNYTTHLPQWYEWDKIEVIWNAFQMDKVSYTIEDLYYNYYFKDRIPFILCESDNLKEGVYSSSFSSEKLDLAFRNKIWITNSPDGWTSLLDDKLKNYYGI